MKKLIVTFIGIMIILSFGQCRAGQGMSIDIEGTFQKANAEYASGNYEDAIKDLEAIIAAGFNSGNVYYNLGNCYFKSGKLGEAILNYERAKLFMPRDSDLLSNYDFAKSKMKQKDTNPKKHWIVASLEMASGYLTYNEWLWLAFIFYYLVIALIFMYIFRNEIRRSISPVIILLTTILVIFIEPLYQKTVYLKQAGIVVMPIIDARFEPLKRSEVNFPLYEGMKVNILTTRSQWLKVKRPDGKIGWVERSSVKPVVD